MPQINDRQILIFGSDDHPLLVQQQLALFNKEDVGMKERQLKIIVVKKGESLSRKYAVKQGEFTVILIGKDGSEKFRTNEIFTTEKLFSLIDAMPMRQAEMNRKKSD